MSAETVKVTGKVPTVKSRRIWVQRKIGKRWVAVSVRTRTTRIGAYATTFRAPDNGSYTMRMWAPRARVSGRVRAQYVTSARRLSVVAQTAALSMPPTVTPDTQSAATATFRRVRAGVRFPAGLALRGLGHGSRR